MTESKDIKNAGGWFPVSKRDKRRIFSIPTPRALTCWAVWSELLDYANWKKLLRFKLSQVTLARRVGIGRRTVHHCLHDLKAAGLLTYTAPKTATVGNDSTKFALKPSVPPWFTGDHPPWSPSDHPHGRSTSSVNRPLLNNGDNQRLSPVDKNDAPDPAPAPDGAGRPASGKKVRRNSWMPEGGLK